MEQGIKIPQPKTGKCLWKSFNHSLNLDYVNTFWKGSVFEYNGCLFFLCVCPAWASESHFHRRLFRRMIKPWHIVYKHMTSADIILQKNAKPCLEATCKTSWCILRVNITLLFMLCLMSQEILFGIGFYQVTGLNMLDR